MSTASVGVVTHGAPRFGFADECVDVAKTITRRGIDDVDPRCPHAVFAMALFIEH